MGIVLIRQSVVRGWRRARAVLGGETQGRESDRVDARRVGGGEKRSIFSRFESNARADHSGLLGRDRFAPERVRGHSSSRWSACSREENGDDAELSEGAVGTALDVASGEPQHEFGGGFDNGLRRWGLVEEFTRAREFLASAAIGEQAEMANAYESQGEDMEEETADELLDGQRHGLDAVGVSVITPTETDLALGEVNEILRNRVVGQD